jgi:hypothetical protein
MRSLLLVSVLVLLIAGAYLWHSTHFVVAASRPAAIAPGGGGDVVFAIGGGPAPGAPGAVAKEARESAGPAGGQGAQPEGSPGNGATGEMAPPGGAAAAPKGNATNTETAQPVTVKITKGMTIYGVALKYYGSGAPAVRRDIVAASHISDETKIKEGTIATLPDTAGGRARR